MSSTYYASRFFYNSRRGILKMANTDGPSEDREDTKVVFDIEQRKISIFCKIDHTAVLMMQSILDELQSTDRKGLVTIILNTEGGIAFQGLAIYDLIKSSGLNFRTIILGEVASAGVAIFLAGQERWMYKHASLKFHATAMQFTESKKALEQHEAEVEQRWIRVVNKLYDEITITNSHLTVRQIRRLENNEICLTAEQALKHGLIHKIIG